MLENPNSKKKLKLKKLPKFKTYKGAVEYLLDETGELFGSSFDLNNKN